MPPLPPERPTRSSSPSLPASSPTQHAPATPPAGDVDVEPGLRALLEQTRAELRRSRAEVEAARDANDRLLSSVSHELRTPLSAILLWTTLIEEEKTYEPEQLREAIDAIKRSAEEQQVLIENLVDTTRIVAGRLRLDCRRVEIMPIVHAAVERAGPVAGNKQISWEEGSEADSVSAPVDRSRLQQAIVLLLHNAVKFSPPGARIEVAVRQLESEVQIAVRDSGTGIAAGRIPHLFDGPPTTGQPKAPRTEAGLGYGLLVARQIVAAHGGALTVMSPGIGGGSTFTLRLPRDPTRPISNPAQPAVAADAPLLRGHSVLLVIDGVELRETLATALQDAGADVCAVDSAPAAAEACERRRPDVIVCDLALPTIDAAALLRDLREIEREQHASRAPALAVATSGSSDSVLAFAKDAGFDRCLQLPADPHQVVTAVTECLRPAVG